MKNSRIVRLQVDNVKKLRAIDITPPENLVVIGGKNDQGKSSVLDSIAWVLGGAKQLPEQPVREGEKGARIIADLGDLIVTRTITAAGGGGLTVKSKDGATYSSPQAILDKLTGKLSFDPFAFTLLKPADQLNALRKLVGLDFTEEDAHIRTLYTERTEVNRAMDQADALHLSIEGHANAPAQEIDVAELVARLTAAEKSNQDTQARIDAAEKARGAALDAQQEADLAEEALTKLSQQGESIRHKLTAAQALTKAAHALSVQASEAGLGTAKAQELYTLFVGETAKLEGALGSLPEDQKRLTASRDEKKQLAENAAKAAEEAERASAAVIVDVSPLREQLTNADALNRKARANAEKAKHLARRDELAAKSQELTRSIEAIEAQKKEKIAAAKFPVEGLSFCDGGILYKGLPFAQASTAVKIRVSVAMAIALNPELKVMLIRDGSLLDDDSLALLGQLAFEHGAQVWIERVGKGAECAVIIEDGEVLEPAAPAGGDAS